MARAMAPLGSCRLKSTQPMPSFHRSSLAVQSRMGEAAAAARRCPIPAFFCLTANLCLLPRLAARRSSFLFRFRGSLAIVDSFLAQKGNSIPLQINEMAGKSPRKRVVFFDFANPGPFFLLASLHMMPRRPASRSATSGIKQPPGPNARTFQFESSFQAGPDLLVVTGFVLQPGFEKGDGLGRFGGWRFDLVQF